MSASGLLQGVYQSLLCLSPPGPAEVATWIHCGVAAPGPRHPPGPITLGDHRRPYNALQAAAIDNYQFRTVNELLRELAALNENEFFDWAPLFEARRDGEELWYADGFHANSVGNKILAEALYDRLASVGFPTAH